MKKAARKKKESFFETASDPIIEAIIPEVKEQRSVKKLISNKPFLIGTIVIFLLVLGAGGFYTYLLFQQDAAPVASNTKETQEQIESLLREVGELVLLPEGEIPQIATVTDVEKLKEQPFFKGAQNGDKVLIFSSTKEAILYRQSIKKIITIAPINTPDQAAPNTSLGSTPSGTLGGTPVVAPIAKKIRVAVLNSTKESGLARKGANLLDKEKFEIISTSNAQGEYPTSSLTIVNKTDVKNSTINDINSLFTKTKLVTKSLPTGESPPAGADIVIILGSDFSERY